MDAQTALNRMAQNVDCDLEAEFDAVQDAIDELGGLHAMLARSLDRESLARGLIDDQDAELARLRVELEECRRTQALGGPPPPVDKNWANANVGRPSSADDPNAPALRRDRSGGEAG